MTANIARLREHYKPDRVRVLFVAESPPESTDDEVRFFYNPRQERWDHMYRSVMKAVFPDFAYRKGEKDKWLREFKKHGYYMIDATDQPLNRLSPARRREKLNAAVNGKLHEIAELVSPSTPILLVKKNVFSAFDDRLRRAGYNVIHKKFLPFPSHGHQVEFVEACRNSLRRYRGGM
jgi:hypothetical protein